MTWQLAKLKTVATLVNGRAYKRHEMLSAGKYPLMRVGNFFSNRSWYYSDLELPGRQYCDFGDLLYAWSASFGPRIWDGGKVIYHYHIWKIVLDESKVDKKYLYYALAADVEEIKKAQGSGSTMIHVTKTAMEEREIPLPPLAEQKRIAAILDKADAIRRKRQQAIQLADEFLRAAYVERFGDPKDSPYDILELKEVTTKITDGAHHTPTYVDSGIPFLRVTDINKKEIKWGKTKFIPRSEHQELIKRCNPEKGDVLYSKNGTIGVPKLISWDDEFSIFVSLCLIKPDHTKLRGKYLESFLKTPFALKQAKSKAKSATVTNLHLVEIREIKLPIPPLEIQDEWIYFLDKYESCVNTKMNSFKQLNDMFSSLSQKAFKGEL